MLRNRESSNARTWQMRILIATDAWHPQVNGVVRTLTSLARSGRQSRGRHRLPDPRRLSLGRPCRPIRACGWRCPSGARSPGGSRRPRRTPFISRPKVRSAGRRAPIAAAISLAFTTSYTTRFPEYVAVRTGIPDSCRLCGAAALSRRRRDDHGRDASLRQELGSARLHASSASGPAASTPICFIPTIRRRWICRGRSS